MELHGFDDPTTDIHPMYSPDSHNPDTDTDGLGATQHPGPELDDGSGIPDTAGPPATPEMVELDVNGHAGQVSATIDTDHDGRADTAIISSGDGHRVAVTDSNHDGVADHALLIDDRGRVVDSATFDRSTGRWHDDGADPTSTSTAASPTGSQVAAGAAAGGATGSTAQIEVDVDGRQARVDATIDTDHDGRADTAIISGGDKGQVAVTDTDSDGHADEAALINRGGHVADTAHVDPRTGQWVRGDDGHNPYAVGESVPQAGGSTATASTGDNSADTSVGTSTGASGGDRPDPAGGTQTATVNDGPSHGKEMPITIDAGGRTNTVTATMDVDHDGVNDTAVVRGVDGTQVTFSDTDGDGEADQATVIDQHGKVVGSARFDPVTGQWHDDPPR